MIEINSCIKCGKEVEQGHIWSTRMDKGYVWDSWICHDPCYLEWEKYEEIFEMIKKNFIYFKLDDRKRLNKVRNGKETN